MCLKLFLQILSYGLWSNRTKIVTGKLIIRMHSQAGHKLKSALTYVLMQYLHKSDEFIRKYYSRIHSFKQTQSEPNTNGRGRGSENEIGNTLWTTLYNSPNPSMSQHHPRVQAHTTVCTISIYVGYVGAPTVTWWRPLSQNTSFLTFSSCLCSKW